jgi:hypothetical protein
MLYRVPAIIKRDITIINMFKTGLSYLVFRKVNLVFLKGHRRYTPSAVNISRNICNKPTRIAKAINNICNSLDTRKGKYLTAIIIGSETKIEITVTPIVECV